MLASYASYQAALALPPDAEPERVLDHVARHRITAGLFAGLLAACKDIDTVLARELGHADPERRHSAHLIIHAAQVEAGPAVLQALATQIANLSSEHDPNAAAVYTANALGPRAAPLAPELAALATRIDIQREYYFHKTVVTALRRLEAG